MKGMFDGWTEGHVIKAMVRQGRPVVHEEIWGSVEPVEPVVLVLPWPPSVNHRHVPVRRGKVVNSDAVETYKKLAKEKIGLQHRGYAPLTGRLHVRIEFYQPDDRVRDLDNLGKDPLDSCKDMHVYGDDGQIDWLEYKRFYDCGNPYIKLMIERIT